MFLLNMVKVFKNEVSVDVSYPHETKKELRLHFFLLST